MHLLGVRFETTQAAKLALRELRARFAIADVDAEIQPLGTTQYDAPTSDLILAARFKTEIVPEVLLILEHLGGTVVVEHAESPSFSAAPETETPTPSTIYRPIDDDPARPGAGRWVRDRVEAMGLPPEGRDRGQYPRADWRRSSARNLRRI